MASTGCSVSGYSPRVCTSTFKGDTIRHGARNTHEKRYSAPDRRGFVVFTACVAGCTPGIQYPFLGNTGWPTFRGFSSSRRLPCLRNQHGERCYNSFFSGLESRSEKEGSDAMFLASIFALPRIGVAS